MIPHGAASTPTCPPAVDPQPHLLTWGLLGPGKGIEWALRALAQLDDLDPAPTYTVAGRTHPKVLEQQRRVLPGRSAPARRATRASASQVRYDPVYRDDASLSRLIRSADVVVLPYDSREQVTSGVLIEAVAAGVPVVATPFPHAVELLTDGPGLLVPHQDPAALAKADPADPRPSRAWPRRLAGRTARPTSALRWPAVAARYDALAASGCSSTHAARTRWRRPRRDASPAPSFAHLARLTDDTGLFEHARHAIVRREHGYCTDDVARGLLVASREPEPTPELPAAGGVLPGLPHPRAGPAPALFRNRLGHDRRWADEPGLGDWWGRALWGLGTAAARSPARVDPRRGAGRLHPRRSPGVRRRRARWCSPGWAPPRCCARTRTMSAAASLLADAATAVGIAGPGPGLAVAAGAADLRQRRAGRGRHRRRPPARRRPAARRPACGC